MAYAQDTSVSVEKSKAEIEHILAKYGAGSFGYMTDADKAMIAFRAHGKAVRFLLPLPSIEQIKSSSKRRLSSSQALARQAQANRARWRALGLCVKAKLEAVSCGITTFEQEFLAHLVLPNGKTMGEHAIPMIEAATKNGQMPNLSLTP